MREQVISFETAELAKDKGFNIPCVWHYHDKCKEHPVERGGGSIKVSKDWNSDEHKTIVNFYSAPTQALLQKFLREEHNTHITIDLTHTGKYYFYLNGDIMEAFDNNLTIKAEFETYGEALEEALVSVLKSIK